MRNKPFIFLVGVLLYVGLEGCKRIDISPLGAPDYRDRLYAFAQDLYLWHDRLPSANDFAPRSFEDPNELVNKVRTFSPLNSAGANVDKWSFLTTRTAYEAQQQGTVTGRFGFSYRFTGDTLLYVTLVQPGSPMDAAGIKRGFRIRRINTTAATTANASAIASLFGQQAPLTIEFVNHEGTFLTKTVTRGDFTTSPILVAKILKLHGKRIGYISFNTFTDKLEEDLVKAHAQFEAEGGIDELVLDLRYNGGGTTRSATRLASMVVPKSAVSQKFFGYTYNTKNTQRNTSENFQAVNAGWHTKRVFFITTRASASASELLIEGLKPYMPVLIVGDRTSGKPVGQLGGVIDEYIFFPTSFRVVNSRGEGDYFEGIPVDKVQVDDVTHDFGNPREACLADILSFIQNGTLPARRSVRMATDEQTLRANAIRYEEPQPEGLLLWP
jgi:hypothetical protein